jgi:hypothetical protein
MLPTSWERSREQKKESVSGIDQHGIMNANGCNKLLGTPDIIT